MDSFHNRRSSHLGDCALPRLRPKLASRAAVSWYARVAACHSGSQLQTVASGTSWQEIYRHGQCSNANPRILWFTYVVMPVARTAYPSQRVARARLPFQLSQGGSNSTHTAIPLAVHWSLLRSAIHTNTTGATNGSYVLPQDCTAAQFTIPPYDVPPQVGLESGFRSGSIRPRHSSH